MMMKSTFTVPNTIYNWEKNKNQSTNKNVVLLLWKFGVFIEKAVTLIRLLL